MEPTTNPPENPPTDVESEISDNEDVIRKSSRTSKPVEHFAPPQKRKIEARKKLQAGEGKGLKLGDIEVVSKGISKAAADSEGLKRLHVCLFNSIGKESTRKRDIRAWNGSQNSEDRERIEKTLSTTKKQESILTFLDIPKDEGLKKPRAKRRASTARKRKISKTTRQGSGFSNFLTQRTKEMKSTESGKLLTPKEITEMLSVEWTSMTSVEKAAFGTPQKAGQKRKRSSTAGKTNAKKAREGLEEKKTDEPKKEDVKESEEETQINAEKESPEKLATDNREADDDVDIYEGISQEAGN
ncbi:Protein DEK, putative [Perkinsus marinus ATCC 50983]|uniref:Protein DEK, putative n=1 Tax=Perkinsus marinus (strain ATCC 50983 / TXsc) TaxID=423536 RepID=C5KIN3_PERM5|nr:Protein DEK, putative [Perkinsus marinus ATCC 50983]EER15648.1 Protein DEK, putative [Perkinsus marinus ATCC 50983]|eukprot:XP_002783852.1 Protein DEK, putative [Perkinsus marinus ATCC 50983]